MVGNLLFQILKTQFSYQLSYPTWTLHSMLLVVRLYSERANIIRVVMLLGSTCFDFYGIAHMKVGFRNYRLSNGGNFLSEIPTSTSVCYLIMVTKIYPYVFLNDSIVI